VTDLALYPTPVPQHRTTTLPEQLRGPRISRRPLVCSATRLDDNRL